MAFDLWRFERASEAKASDQGVFELCSMVVSRLKAGLPPCLRAARRFEVKDSTLEAALDQAAGTL